MLENKMIDIEKKNPDGTNAFWIAARFGKGDAMKVLAEHGIDVLNENEKGFNALHIAARYNYIDIVTMLA
jgi:ankyrin repeat protein